MIYVKVFDHTGAFLRVEECMYPMYVMVQPEHNSLIGCARREADGIVTNSENGIYCIEGRSLGNFADENTKTAVFASLSDYDEYVMQQEQTDPEDDSPVIPEDVPEETILTRAELTRRITELEAQNEFLQDCILEMSEAIYG